MRTSVRARAGRAWRSPLPVLLCAVLAGACAAQPVAPETRFRGPTMGTTWSVVLGGRLEPAEADGWQTVFEGELARVNAVFSTWDPDSELSRFNTSGETGFRTVSPELLDLLDTAHAVSRASGGAYDVTAGEVLALYGGGGARAGQSRTLPDSAVLDDALGRTGAVQLVRLGDRLRKRDARLRIDLSSIAKGHAVDRLGRILEAAGVADYLVEIGGEVRTRGRAPDGRGWRVGIETPDGRADAGLALHDAHLASSGSYRQWRELDGVRVSHVIDARDGQPLRHDLVAVTVLADSTARADAWATALLALGADEAAPLARRHGLDVQLVRRAGDGFGVWRSDGFAARLIHDEDD